MAIVDVAARARASRGGKPAEVTGPARSILRGELENIGLPTLLTILDMERRSGMLIVEHGQQLGRLHVREGRVIRARIEGPSKPAAKGTAGAEAVYQMLAWCEGQFELWQAQVEGRDEVGEATTFLLLEGARLADEARGIASPSVDAGELIDAW